MIFKTKAHPRHHHHRHKNLSLLLIATVVFFLLSRNPAFHTFLLSLGNLGYIGAFIAGALFVSTFTVSIGAVVLLVLATNMPPFEIGVVAALGAVLCNLVLFKFVKDNLTEEIVPIYNELGGHHLTKVLHTKYFSWSIPVIGALLIALPFPDELGVTLLGLSKMSTMKFLILCFTLHVVGITLLITAANFLR